MAHDRPDEIAQPGSHDDALSSAVRAALLDEGLLAEIVERVQARLAGSAPPAPPQDPPASPTTGPPPIGPYEISPDFAAIRWDVISPPGKEWSTIDEVRRSAPDPARRGPAGGPRVARGSRVGPEPAED